MKDVCEDSGESNDMGGGGGEGGDMGGGEGSEDGDKVEWLVVSGFCFIKDIGKIILYL